MKAKLITAGVMVGLIVALACGQEALQNSAEAAQANMVEVPLFEVDPLWPQPLPNNWIMGSTIGVGVDSRDHVYIIHRQGSLNERTEANAPHNAACCLPAPPVLEFDPEGNLVNSWGGPQEGAPYTWPASNHGLTLDPDDNIWIGGNGRGDSHILKFTRDGEFIQQIGEPGQGPDSHSTQHFSMVAKVMVDDAGEEAYVADGYGNKRVAVLDAETGEFLRYWGAYGNEPSDENLGPYDPDAPLAQQFRTPVHCAEPTQDGLVYVCDRPNNRIQVFER
ncbi:MAG: hypothetical protein R3223_01965, partial [Longimicrobiales bacterium]|nr:hypothetical protein [Longimicrobiales bacterium]